MAFQPAVHSRCCRATCGCVIPNEVVKDIRNVLLILLGICTAIVVITLLALSVQDVDAGDVAVAYHKVGRSLESTPLAEGRHWETPDTALIVYPVRFVTFEQDVPCLSSDGVPINFVISVEYQVQPATVRQITLEYHDANNHRKLVELAIIDMTKDVCAAFKGGDFSGSQRALADQMLFANMTTRFQTRPYFASIGNVQLRNIVIHPDLAAAVGAKQEALQQVQIALSERVQVLTQEETALRVAEENIRISITQAQAEADSVLFEATQQAEALNAVWTDRSSEVGFGLSALGSSSALTYLEEYLRPTLESRIRSPELQTCLQDCVARNDCWACWVGRSVQGVSVSP